MRFLAVLIFVYVVLFEFILPVNKYLPKPSLLYESITHIWQDYSLLYAISISTSMVIVSLLAGYFSSYINAASIFKTAERNIGVVNALKIFLYVPVIFCVALFSFWFSEYYFAEFLFVLLVSVVLSYSALFRCTLKVHSAYVDVAKNLGLTPTDVYQKVYWKSSQPLFTNEYFSIHRLMWGAVLVFEFVVNAHGIGHVMRLVLEYRDFTALINIALMISVLVFIGDSIIRFIRHKFITWID